MYESFILIAMTYLIVKHFVCDFPIRIQTAWMFTHKGIYGHPAGIVHAAIHAVASVPVFIWGAAGLSWYKWHGLTPLQMVGVLMIFEFLVHYHMDWFKMWYGKRKGWTPATPQFWTFLGIDQLVHYLTYIAMVAVWVS